MGASVTLAELEETLKYYVKTKPGNAIEYLTFIIIIWEIIIITIIVQLFFCK